MTAAENLDAFIEQYHLALGEFVKGNPQPAQMLFSHREDATLANPFGPVARGWNQIAETTERAAANYADGEALGFDSLARCATSELAYIVEIERFRAKVGGVDKPGDVTLRCTTVLRPEEGTWKVVHRHADPITTARPAESVLQA